MSQLKVDIDFKLPLRPYQVEGVNKFVDFPHALFVDEMGVGKQQPVSEPVLTPWGWSTMGELSVGDYVVGSDGKPTIVEAVYPQEDRRVFKVTFSDGTWTRCGADHLWRVQTNNDYHRGNSRTLSTQQIMESGLRDGANNRKYRIPIVEPVEYMVYPTLPYDPYTVGVALGDGSFKPSGRVEICTDKEILKAIRAIDIKPHETSDYTGYGIVYLKGINKGHTVSDTKYVPHIYMTASPGERLALLQGLLDTDGSPIKNGGVEFSSTSPMLVDAVIELTESLGGIARNRTQRTTDYTYNGETRQGKPSERVNVKLPSYMTPFRLQRKIKNWKVPTKYKVTRLIESIEQVEDEESVCIKVGARDSLYVTRHFIVTHNTVQAIALDLVRRQQHAFAQPSGGWKTLVVCPLTGVVDQWVAEFQRFTNLRVRRINPKKRELLFSEPADVYVIHHDALRIMEMDLVNKLPQGEWLHMIIDEAHKIKNRKAKVSKAAVKVGKHFAHRTGATGTPMENRPDELWHLLHWCFPDKQSREAVDMKLWFQKVLNSFWRYYNRYVDYYEDEFGYHHITGPRNTPELRELRDPMWIRRLKSDVLSDLPPKQYQQYEVELTPKQRKAYKSMKEDLIAWIGENENQPVVSPVAISQLVRLQQFALAYGELKTTTIKKRDGSQDQVTKVNLHEPSSKLDALVDILEDLGDTQCVIYSTSKQIINMAQIRLEDKLDLSTGLITGDVPDIKRSAVIKSFQAGDTQVILATIRAGGVGINLQNCNTIIFLDRDWSPGVNQQAEDRVHRSGQEHDNVHIIDIVAKDTIDQRKDRKLKRKWEWIKEVVGA